MGRNEFMNDRITNGPHARSCFCVNCRQEKVNIILDSNSTNNQLEDEFLSDTEEYRRLNSLFNETIKKLYAVKHTDNNVLRRHLITVLVGGCVLNQDIWLFPKVKEGN